MLVEEDAARRLLNLVNHPCVNENVKEIAETILSIVDRKMGLRWRSAAMETVVTC